MDDLYREQIIDRLKNPRHRGELDPHDYSYATTRCAATDRIDVQVDGDERGRATFPASATPSRRHRPLLAESIVGKSLAEVRRISKDDILEMLGIELGPVRLKCALLSLKVLKAGVYGIEAVETELT
jgi:nitrogen fixation NifU-like protein